jgi:hypothetical protein
MIRIFENIHCTVRKQFRFPLSKRRRIRAKWAKREFNLRHLPDPNVYVMKQQGLMVGHPATIAKLRQIESHRNQASEIMGSIDSRRRMSDEIA